MKFISYLLIIVGIIGLILAAAMYGDIGISAAIGSITALLSGAGFYLTTKTGKASNFPDSDRSQIAPLVTPTVRNDQADHGREQEPIHVIVPNEDLGEDKAHFIKNSDDELGTCSSCGAKQREVRESCFNCGKIFVKQ